MQQAANLSVGSLFFLPLSEPASPLLASLPFDKKSEAPPERKGLLVDR